MSVNKKSKTSNGEYAARRKGVKREDEAQEGTLGRRMKALASVLAEVRKRIADGPQKERKQ